jgi:hypothetical protein
MGKGDYLRASDFSAGCLAAGGLRMTKGAKKQGQKKLVFEVSYQQVMNRN